MSRLLKSIFTLCLATALFSTQQAKGQCTTVGLVIESPSCGKMVFDLVEFEFYLPFGNELDTIAHNTAVTFDFEIAAEEICVSDTHSVAVIHCLSFTDPDPSVSCDADFFHTENFVDGSPTVVFEPVSGSADLEYLWNFGDNEISTEMAPVHTYQEQGLYEVCLTLNGPNCQNEISCQTLDLQECKAAFSYETVEDGLVEFIDFSEGNYTQWEWKMGDGEVFTNQVVDNHGYNGVDIYTVCLTVWNDNGCSHEYCDYVFTGTGDVCDFSDCVLPGDTDVDETANVYDLLPIGVAYGSEGPPRSINEVAFPSMAWEPQYSPDWGLETISGIDFKHIDCNGDGAIDAADLAVIEENYLAPGDIFQVTADGQPYFWLEFDFDTVVINDNTPAFITLEADLMAGVPNLPFEDLRGFALQMDYPEDMVLEGGGVEINYHDNSFFGSSNDILWMEHDRTGVGVVDVGFTRKTFSGYGFGKVADVGFIIISDLIPRAEYSIPFDVNLRDVLAVNQYGAELTLDQPDEPVRVTILNQTTTDAKNEQLNQQVSIYPNPATDKVWMSFGDLKANKVEVFNALGQRMKEHVIQSTPYQMDVSDFAEGIYILHVHTDEGLVKKRMAVNR